MIKHFIIKHLTYLLFTFALLVAGQHTSRAQSHHALQRYFGKAYRQSLDYLRQNKAILKQCLPANHHEAAFILSMGFPELLRFKALQNQMETAFLEVLYVNKGPAYANFSVGRFQMKPSFAESLEKQAKTYTKGTPPLVYLYEVSGIKKIRKKRVHRLNQLSWQLKYLYTLYKVLNRRYAHKKFASNAQKLRFFAAAYNYGFLNKAQKIHNWSQIKAFPHGRNHIGKQHNFSLIALDFYLHEALELMK